MDAVVGLGANLGDPRAALAWAVGELHGIGRVAAVSALHETDPVGPPQPIFLNAAVRLDAPLEPGALLALLLGVERRAGRIRAERFGPRILDLDLLWAEGVRLETESLILPHPRLRERAFALVPLLEVAPDARDPATGERLTEWLARLSPGGVRRVDGPVWAGGAGEVDATRPGW